MATLTTGGVAKHFDVSRDKIQTLRTAGIPKSIEKIAGRWMYGDEAIEELEQHFARIASNKEDANQVAV